MKLQRFTIDANGRTRSFLRNQQSVERFIEKAKAYVGIRKLDGYILHELVKAIYVESPRRVDGKKEQRIHIEYNGIGFIPIYDLIEQETA